MPGPHPTLTTLRIAADPAAWRACGIPPSVGGVDLDITPAAGDDGIQAWGWEGLADPDGLDGIPTFVAPPPRDAPRNGPLQVVDHVVVATGDLDRTVAAFDAAGLDRRRIRDAGPLRQAFYVAGPCLVEVVAPVESTGEPTRLWGITFVAADLDATAAALGDHLGNVRDAVQPGRRIATFRREAGLGLPVAVMTPRR